MTKHYLLDQPTNYHLLVLGLGNILMSDDGLGIKAVEILKQQTWPEQVLIRESGSTLFHYFDEICRAKTLYIVDAVHGGKPPGTVYYFPLLQASSFKQTYCEHDATLLQIIELARHITGLPKKVIIFGIEPHSLDLGFNLSDCVEVNLRKLIELLAKEIEKETNKVRCENP